MDNMRLNKHYLVELNQLMCGLALKGISFTFTQIFDGGKVDCGNWDAVCHSGSYGSRSGLLEVMGKAVARDAHDAVEGWLTAQEILNRL